MGFLSQVVNGLGTRYRAVVGARLKQYGLLLDDVLRDTHPDVKVALERLDPQSYKLRQMRMRRALDLEMKHKQMPPEMQDYDPFRPYLRPAIAKARLRRIEREQNDF